MEYYSSPKLKGVNFPITKLLLKDITYDWGIEEIWMGDKSYARNVIPENRQRFLMDFLRFSVYLLGRTDLPVGWKMYVYKKTDAKTRDECVIYHLVCNEKDVFHIAVMHNVTKDLFYARRDPEKDVQYFTTSYPVDVFKKDPSTFVFKNNWGEKKSTDIKDFLLNKKIEILPEEVVGTIIGFCFFYSTKDFKQHQEVYNFLGVSEVYSDMTTGSGKYEKNSYNKESWHAVHGPRLRLLEKNWKNFVFPFIKKDTTVYTNSSSSDTELYYPSSSDEDDKWTSRDEKEWGDLFSTDATTTSSSSSSSYSSSQKNDKDLSYIFQQYEKFKGDVEKQENKN